MLVEDINAAVAVSCSWTGSKWKEWPMKCGECSQGPHGIPGEEVSRFEYDVYFKFEKFLLRLHCTALN